MQSDILETSTPENILLVRLNRPKKPNAVNADLILGFETIYNSIPEGIKSAVIYGEGKHFSAGLGLSELKERDTFQGLHHSFAQTHVY